MARSKTMTVDVSIWHSLKIFLTGISIKKFDEKLKFGDVNRMIDEEYCSLDCIWLCYESWNVDDKTATVKLSFLVKCLTEIHEEFPFDKVKIEGYYHHSGEEIMNQIKNK